MKPSMSPRSNSSDMVTPGGASSMRTPAGSLMAIFSGRPGCSIPPRTQTMSDGFTPECPGHERRNSDIGAIAFGGLHREARHRQFADVEIHAAEGAEEDFLGRQVHEHRIDAVDLHRAVHERTHPVVVADRDGELEFRHRP